MSGRFGVINQLQKWKVGDPISDPVVILALNEWGMNEHIVTISATLANASEIDLAIDQLKEDLEKVRQEAKHILRSQQEKIGSSIRG